MRGTNCVLYAEDDNNDVFLLQHAFKQAGITHPLEIVQNGQDVIDYLRGTASFSDRARYPFPGLLILDLKMPIKNGMEVLQWIRQQPDLSGLVVIAYSSSQLDSDVERAYRLGANSFVAKPSSLPQMVEFARLLKAWWLERNQFVTPMVLSVVT